MNIKMRVAHWIGTDFNDNIAHEYKKTPFKTLATYSSPMELNEV
ncbi:hypothetical protein [Maribacter polysaccharolyticus]|nr:hypothetical protein [Maribacter polysaccharolyticus]MDE3740913.1 hypothetical protein [Maribacter polysaccharolyticus]